MRNRVQEIDREHGDTAFFRAWRRGGCAFGHVTYLKLLKVFGVFVCGFLFVSIFSPQLSVLFYIKFVGSFGVGIPSLVRVRIIVGRPSHHTQLKQNQSAFSYKLFFSICFF